MSTNPSAKKQRARLALAALPLILAAVSLLVSSPRASLAQQDRQLTQTGSTNTTPSKRIALVIGNGAYTTAPRLKNPPNDAREMSATLRALGFDVSSGINVSQRDMKRLIREFGMKLKGGGSGLFYYAGHGVQSKGRNYLIPVDANIQSEAEVEDSGVDAALVMNFMDDAQNGLNIVILDACRNNPFARSFRSANDGLAQVDAPTGTLIAYATAPGHVASDGTDQNGLYTSELLKQMRVPNVSITDMFMRVRAEVMRQTGSKQVPWESSSLVGSFYFSRGASGFIPTTSEVKVDASAFELSYWETIKSSQSADDYKAYLEKYPAGQFASLAKNRISALEAVSEPKESKPDSRNSGATELAFWDAIKNSASADDYRAYLEKYPNGEFIVLAKNRLVPLEATEKEKVKADELARNTTSFKGLWYDRSGTLVIAPNKIQFVYDDSNRYSNTGTVWTPDQSRCEAFVGARVEGDFIREIRAVHPDGRLLREKRYFQAESSAAANEALSAVRKMCANPVPTSSSANVAAGNSASSQTSAADPTKQGRTFRGYFGGWMAQGFTARPGTLTISPAGIQFVWDKGRDGIAGNKSVTFVNEDLKPYELRCSNFTHATLEAVFIREIRKADLLEAIGWDGNVHRFMASNPVEAAGAFAAVREACNQRP